MSAACAERTAILSRDLPAPPAYALAGQPLPEPKEGEDVRVFALKNRNAAKEEKLRNEMFQEWYQELRSTYRTSP